MKHSTIQRWTFAALVALGLTAGEFARADEPKPPEKASPPAAKKSASPERLDALIRQLGDKDYFVRQRAQDELSQLGFEAFDALNTAATNDDFEIASRAKYLLRLMRVEWTAESDSAEVKQWLRDYEFSDARTRQARMRALADLPDGQGVAALCRLARFERSSMLSKAAAAAILGARAGGDPPDAATIDAVKRTLGDCKRPAAVWLLAWTRLGAEPDAVMTQWKKLLEDEHALLRRDPNETSAEIVGAMTRFEISQLKRLGKNDDATAAMRRLVELETGNAESLAQLLDWLLEQKAWRAIDDLAQRFAARFAVEPSLLYVLSEAYDAQGAKDRARDTADHAFRLAPGKNPQALAKHFMSAQTLRERGRFDWARREYEYVIEKSDKQIEYRAMAQLALSEMFHDQEQYLEAAETVEKLVKAIDGGKVNESQLFGRTPAEIRARMYYFFSCHWNAKGDAARRSEFLDKALKADPADIESLIACYHLPGQTPEFHTRIVALIRQAAAGLREQIAASPENYINYNQLAWLIGNTEGDFDEAMRLAKKAIELHPSEAGYIDTLAHVYFGKGDYENAVKEEARAEKLDPHSGQIKRKLKLFREKAAEKKKS